MKITIITPVFNDPRVTNALESVRAQKLDHDVEIIVVDGASTDGTLDALMSMRDSIDVLVTEPDAGIYDAMNKGISRATGDIVGILNADDRYHDDMVLHRVVEKFQHAPDAELVYGDLLYVDVDGNPVRYWKSGKFRKEQFYLGWMPPHPTVFLRREAYERYGVFDIEFPIASDYELLLRMLVKNDVTPAYIDEVLVKMATGGRSNGSVRSIIQANLEIARAWRKNKLRGGYLVPLIKPARKVVQYVNPRRAMSTPGA